MPRVEILIDSEKSRKYLEESGNGSSTHDVCCECVKEFEEGQPVPEEYKKELATYNGEPSDSGPMIFGSLEVAHPDYEDYGHKCAICDKLLTQEDD